MRRRDWAILTALIVAGWPRLRATPLGQYLAGDCEFRRGGCGGPNRSGPVFGVDP